MSKKDPVFSLKDVTISALGLAIAIPWTEYLKNGMTNESLLIAMRMTLIVAIIAIVLNHLHLFARSAKEGGGDHPIKILEAFESIW